MLTGGQKQRQTGEGFVGRACTVQEVGVQRQISVTEKVGGLDFAVTLQEHFPLSLNSNY